MSDVDFTTKVEDKNFNTKVGKTLETSSFLYDILTDENENNIVDHNGENINTAVIFTYAVEYFNTDGSNNNMVG